MDITVNRTKITLEVGDITVQRTDAIVNAANPSLLGGGGVDGAIHRAGGPAILAECKQIIARIGSLEPGRAVATTGGNLAARFVIHTVGPIWRGGERGEPAVLANAYRESLLAAKDLGAKSVAFPSISTGIYGYPAELAAKVALGAVIDFAKNNADLDEIKIVLFSQGLYEIYGDALESHKMQP